MEIFQQRHSPPLCVLIQPFREHVCMKCPHARLLVCTFRWGEEKYGSEFKHIKYRDNLKYQTKIIFENG